ncbi:hypothetical protein [Hymenobacter sp. B81]|uniref:hypothetical protein n=1 Tax=Hymenobacter sp. B81 TaxID=3344878 RepID=UPI0037DD753A
MTKKATPTPSADAPVTVRVKPLPRPEPTTATECSTLAELIHSLGSRAMVAERWGVAPRTIALRMQKPETASLEELQRLGALTGLDLLTVVKLAYHQMQNPIEVPTAHLGRPFGSTSRKA